MAGTSTYRWWVRTVPVEGHLLLWLFVVESAVLLGYYLGTGAGIVSVRYALYPFIWMNAGVVGVARVAPVRAPARARSLAAGFAAGYFVVLAFVAGLVALGHGHTHGLSGWSVTLSAPGYGPRLYYVDAWLQLSLVPYRVVGYLALTYLVYATLAEATSSALGGVLGFGSCIGCNVSLVGAALGSVAGGSSGYLAAVSSYSMDLSTATFLLAVGLLVWRPWRSATGSDGSSG